MFDRIVELYRASHRPELDGGRIAFTGPVTARLQAACDACGEIGPERALGQFESGPDLDNGVIEFEWRLGANEHGRFYGNVHELINHAASLSAGAVPSNSYLVDDDIHVGVDPPSDALERTLRLARLIALLRKLALGDVGSGGPRKLLFVRAPAGEAPRTLTLDTRITEACLSLPLPNIDLLRSLVDAGAESSLHIYEHRELFRTAIAGVLARSADASATVRLFSLVESWPQVLQEYDYSADCYVQKFSFEKLRSDLAKAEIDFSARVAAVLGDSTSKVLALPISIAAVAITFTAKDFIEAYLTAWAALGVTVLVVAAVHNQLLAYARVERGFQLAMGEFNGASRPLPQHLKVALEETKFGFAKQSTLLLRVLKVVRVLAWLPPALATTVVACRWPTNWF